MWEGKKGKEQRRIEGERIQYVDPDHPNSVALRPLFPPCRKWELWYFLWTAELQDHLCYYFFLEWMYLFKFYKIIIIEDTQKSQVNCRPHNPLGINAVFKLYLFLHLFSFFLANSASYLNIPWREKNIKTYRTADIKKRTEKSTWLNWLLLFTLIHTHTHIDINP